MWGKPHARLLLCLSRRITPTCVGKAPLIQYWESLLRDHPHMCGESLMVVSPLFPIIGSPPHVWGKLIARHGAPTLARITPTCVGKAYRHIRDSRIGKDHPPHVWGKPIQLLSTYRVNRITPTCVGKASGGY